MAMFKKTEEKRTPASPRERAGAALRLNPGESAISIIGPGMHIQGDVTTDGTVRVEGSVEGTIRAGKAVVLGKEGEIRGNVFTQDAVIGGRITGVIVAESRLELQATSNIDGEIRARAEHLQLDEGARFNGKIQMIDGDGDGGAPPALPPPGKAKSAPMEAKRAPSDAKPDAPAGEQVPAGEKGESRKG